jgi:hypothetical protein
MKGRRGCQFYLTSSNKKQVAIDISALIKQAEEPEERLGEPEEQSSEQK